MLLNPHYYQQRVIIKCAGTLLFTERLAHQSVENAFRFLTLVSVHSGSMLHCNWMDFYGELFATYRDFYNIVLKPEDPGCGCDTIEPGLSPET